MIVDMIFVPTLFHWKQLKNHWHKFNDTYILTYDFSVGSLAQKYGKCIYVQSFLKESELKKHDDEALYLIQAMGALFSDKLIHRGVDIAWHSSRDHRSAMIALLNMRKALPRIFEDLKIKRLALFQELFKPDFAALPNTYYPDIIQAMLAWYAQIYSIQIDWVPGVAHTDSHSDLIFHIISENSRLSPTGKIPLDNYQFSTPIFSQEKFEQVVYLVGYQMEMFDQEQLFHHLKQDPKTLFIVLSLQNTPMFELTQSFLNLDFRYIKFWPFDLAELFKTVDQFHDKFSTMESQIHADYPDIFQNGFLDFQHTFYFNSIKDCARSVEGMYWMSQAFQPDLVLGGGSAIAMSAVGSAVDFFSENDYTTLGIMHGTMYADYQFSYMSLPFKHLAARGKDQIIQIEKFKHKRIKYPELHYLGDLRQHMALGESDRHPDNQLLTKVFSQNLDKVPILLLTSSFNNGMAENICDPQKHLDTWFKLRDIAEKRKDIVFYIKNHPGYDFFGFYSEFCGQSSPFILIDKSIPITLILPHVKLAVCINNYTSAMIECSFCNIPFLYLREAVYKNGNYINSKLVENSSILLEDISELEPSLDRVINEPAFSTSLLEAGQILVKSFTTEKEKDVLKTALSLIDTILKKESKPFIPKENEGGLISWLIQIAYSHLSWKETGNKTNIENLVNSISSLQFSDNEKYLVQAYLNLIMQL